MGDMWTKKYSPENSKSVLGQEKGLSELKSYISGYKHGGDAALVYGPTGCGKTAAVQAIAKELNLELVELNASDLRNKDAINSIVGSASKQMSLFMRGKIILVDEIDGLAGREDRGGLQELLKLITESSFPIVMTANDPFEQKFSALRKAAKMIQFNKIEVPDLLSALKNVCKGEELAYDEDALEAVARRADGDLRAGLIDLFLLTRGEKRLTMEQVSILFDRRRIITIMDALTRIFKTKELDVALSAMDNVDEDIDEIIMWVDENIPAEYNKALDLMRAYDCLSHADVFKGRIARWQHWRLLVYVNSLITAGVALAKDEKYKTPGKYKRPGRPLKIWIWNRKNQLRNSIAAKLAAVTHSSKHYAFQETVPYLQAIFLNDKTKRDQLTLELGLDEKEIEWLSEN